MLRSNLLVVASLAVLAALTAGAVRVAARLTTPVELGRLGLTEVAPAEAEFLRALPHPARVSYYVSPPSELPSELRRIEGQVVEVLTALADAAPERFTFEVVRPDRDPERMAFAVGRRLAPVNVRSVRRDAYTDRQVWSTLEIACGPRDPATIEGLGAEQLPVLRALLLAHLRELIEPSEPRIAFAAPAGFERLRALLDERGELLDVDLDGGAAPPADADLLVWMQPAGPDPATLAALDRYRAAGRGLLIAGSGRRGELTSLDGRPAVDLGPRDLDAAALWEPFGLGVLDAPLFDGRSEVLAVGDERLPVPFLVHSIASDQDFRGLADQPGGTLLFASPTPLSLDGDALRERDLDARVLATSSERSWIRPDLAEVLDPGPLALATLVPESGRAVPKQVLLALLEPRSGLAGPLVASASASPFADEFLGSPNFAHRALVRILLDELTSAERLVAARADLPRPTPIERPDPAGELAWRLAVVGLVPALLVGLALVRGALRPSSGAARGALRLAAGGGLLAVVVALSTFAADGLRNLGLGLDLSDDGLNRLAPTTLALAAEAAGTGGLELEWIASPTGGLPLRMRPGARDLFARLRELERNVDGVRLTRTVPERASAAELAALAARGIAPFRVGESLGDETVVRDVYATLELRAGGRVERLDFPDPLAFEDREFRLAFACRRLANGEPTRVFLISDLPRLSPAEVHEEYLQRRRFAPSGTDVYSLARASLERAGFEVVHADPTPRPGAAPYLRAPADTDALVWLQPRRDVSYALDALADHLHGGGDALVCAQHFNLQAERYRGKGFELEWWPQPQSADIEEFWLPELGITLERTVLFDELSFAAPIAAEINRSATERDYDAQEAALPFFLRASSAHFADRPWLKGVGDQAFVWGNAIALDPERLARAGLEAETLIETSPRSWSFAWDGGTLPPAVLEGPPDGVYAGPRPLAVEVRGSFPLPDQPLRVVKDGPPPPLPPPAGEGRLVLVGASETFKNGWLLDPRFRGDHLLVNLVAHLALEPELAALAGRRRTPRGLSLVTDDERLRWRALVLGGGPAAVLLLGLLTRLGTGLRDRRAAARLLRAGGAA